MMFTGEYGTCKHEPDPKTLKFDKRFGRIAVCLRCGRKISITQIIQHPVSNKLHMKKKARRRLREKR